MDQPYSPWADWLSSFHAWPELIQALWLVVLPATLLGVTWLMLRALRDLIHLARRERGRLIYGIYQDTEDRWMVYRHGQEPKALDWIKPPKEPSGQGEVVRGGSKPER
jgi:hypothetical protein